MDRKVGELVLGKEIEIKKRIIWLFEINELL